TSDGVGDFMQERVEDGFWRAVEGVILGDLDSFLSVLANTQPTLRIRPPERPAMQTVLQQFLVGHFLPILQLHDPALRFFSALRPGSLTIATQSLLAAVHRVP